MARLFRRLSDYNSILLLVDAAMLPYEAGERKRKTQSVRAFAISFSLQSAFFRINVGISRSSSIRLAVAPDEVVARRG